MLKLLLAIILTIEVRNNPYVTCARLWPTRYWVKIENGLSKDILGVHCRKDFPRIRDLGFHQIPVNENFHWTFKRDFWVSIRYKCNLA